MTAESPIGGEREKGNKMNKAQKELANAEEQLRFLKLDPSASVTGINNAEIAYERAKREAGKAHEVTWDNQLIRKINSTDGVIEVKWSDSEITGSYKFREGGLFVSLARNPKCKRLTRNLRMALISTAWDGAISEMGKQTAANLLFGVMVIECKPLCVLDAHDELSGTLNM